MAKCSNIVACRVDTTNVSEDFQEISHVSRTQNMCATQMLRTWQNKSTFGKHDQISNVCCHNVSSFCQGLTTITDVPKLHFIQLDLHQELTPFQAAIIIKSHSHIQTFTKRPHPSTWPVITHNYTPGLLASDLYQQGWPPSSTYQSPGTNLAKVATIMEILDCTSVSVYSQLSLSGHSLNQTPL